MALPLRYNLRSVRERWPVALLAIIGIGLVVAVCVVLMAMSQGFVAALRSTGRDDNVMIVSRGSNSEVTSRVVLEDRNAILQHLPEVQADGTRLASWEWIRVIALPRKSDGRRTNVVLRAVLPQTFLVRTGVHVTVGKPFAPGLDEVIVGRRIRESVRGLEVGGVLNYRGRPLRIVGAFESEGGAFESEVWGDFEVLRAAFRRGTGSNSLVIRVADVSQIEELDRWMRGQPNMSLRAVPEKRYYEEQAGPVAKTIRFLGGLVALVMGIGAVFAAMNTMYRVVAARTREIGTLRAIGFSRSAILLSFVVESALIGLTGGVLGCFVGSTLNGYTTSTSNLQSFSEVAFAFRITPEIIGTSLAFSLAMGILGGLLPAARASRLSIAEAVRED